eukprot:123240-Prymnesium_polylepis.1
MDHPVECAGIIGVSINRPRARARATWHVPTCVHLICSFGVRLPRMSCDACVQQRWHGHLNAGGGRPLVRVLLLLCERLV